MPTVVKWYSEHGGPLTRDTFPTHRGMTVPTPTSQYPEHLNHQDDIIFTICRHTKSTFLVEMIYKPKMLKPTTITFYISQHRKVINSTLNGTTFT